MREREREGKREWADRKRGGDREGGRQGGRERGGGDKRERQRAIETERK